MPALAWLRLRVPRHSALRPQHTTFANGIHTSCILTCPHVSNGDPRPRRAYFGRGYASAKTEWRTFGYKSSLSPQLSGAQSRPAFLERLPSFLQAHLHRKHFPPSPLVVWRPFSQ
ncbi:hypothetical protein B0H19DRAFT_1181321 [Mycena capillaripes]|nr:hypothetical protein B0H19DRAFT_1181321 [Mycena capillaripes]